MKLFPFSTFKLLISRRSEGSDEKTTEGCFFSSDVPRCEQSEPKTCAGDAMRHISGQEGERQLHETFSVFNFQIANFEA